MHVLRKCQRAFEGVSSEWSFCAGTAAGVIFAPAALFLCLLLPRSRALWLAVGTLLVLLCRFLPALWEPVSFEEILNRRTATVEYEVRLEDLRLNEVPWLDSPAAVKGEMRKLKFPGTDEEYSCRGRVIVRSSFPLPRRYGAVLTGRGGLIAPDRDHPNPVWLLICDTWELKEVENSWRSYVLKVRDKLLTRLCSSIKNDTDRHLAAAFYMGMTSGMNLERRRDFAAAGTVHLFAVSGLHVGMAALLILLLLRPLPFRMRCFTAAALVWGYVFLTGAAVPALRAGFMIGLFLFFRGMLLYTTPLRLMGVAAGIIIISDPDSLNSAGFHYSFLITAVLLLLSERLQELRQLEGRLFTIMPCTPENLFKRRLFNVGFSIRAAVISGFAAVLAGSVVSMYHDLALTPGAVAANWFTMPVLGVLFALLPIKLAASFTTDFVDGAVARLIEMIFNYLRGIAEIAGDLAAPFYAYPPGIWLTAAMVLLLLGAVGFRKIKYALCCGGAFLLLFSAFPLCMYLSSSRVTVISSDAEVPPTVVIADRYLGDITVVNSSWKHIPDLERALKRAGASKINELFFSEPRVRNLSGLERLDLRFPVERVIVPPLTGRNWKFQDKLTEGSRAFHCVKEGRGNEILRVFREKNKFAIEYPDSGVMLGWRLEIGYSDNGRAIRFIRQGKEVRAILPWRNKNGVWHYEL